MSDNVSGFRRLLRFVFGHYTPPGFLSAGFRFVRRAIGHHPAAFGTVLGIIVAGALGWALVSVWLETRPQPTITMVSVQAPAARPLTEDGEISPLTLSFSTSALRAAVVGKPVDQGVELRPEIPGRWIAEEDRTLVFRPEKDWPIGQEYRLTLGDELFADHVRLKENDLRFTTASFSARIAQAEFHVHPTDGRIKQVSATISFSHPVDPQSLKQRLTLSAAERGNIFSGRDIALTVDYDQFYGKAFLLSEILEVPEEDVDLVLTVGSGVASSLETARTSRELKTTVAVPGQSTYIQIESIEQTMVRNADYRLEQVLVVETRGRISTSELSRNLEVWVLPKDRPASPGTRAQENFRWGREFVSAEILRLSEALPLQAMPSEHEHESINSFRITADPGSHLYVRIAKGARFFGDYVLAREHDAVVRVQSYPKEVRILHEGAILSMTGEKTLSMLAQGVSGVQLRIGRIKPDHLNHLVSQSNGDIRDLRFMSSMFGEENITDRYYETRVLRELRPAETQYFSFDFSRYLKEGRDQSVRHGLFFFEVREWNPGTNQLGRARSSRLIMVTDLGILAKVNRDKTRELFVQSIARGRPVQGAEVAIIGANGIPIFARSTGSDGHVAIPDLSGMQDSREPVAYVVRQGEDMSFLPYEARGRWLDYTDFDTGGVHGASDPDRLTAFLFSDRGIYRPGDQMEVAMVVKAGDWNRSIGGTPMEVVVTDPRGLAVMRRSGVLAETGFQEVSYKTETTSPTGTYQIDLHTIHDQGRRNLLGSTSVRVEEFLPDRLRITSGFSASDTEGWVSPDGLKGRVGLYNLYGTPAAGHTVKARLSLTPGFLRFGAYPDYSFYDPLRAEKGLHEDLPEATTDLEGRAEVDFDLGRFAAATYTLRFAVDGFEKDGGRSVQSESVALVSPLRYLVGSKSDGDLGFVYRGTERHVRFLAVDPDLKPTDVRGLTLATQEVRHVSVLTKDPGGTYQYQSVEKKAVVKEQPLALPIGGYEHRLVTDTPGDFELVLTNPDGLELSRLPYTVTGQANVTRSLDRTAELQIRLNRADFSPGDEIEVSVKAPYAGSGLLTIERERVYAYRWFSSDTNATVQRIAVPADLEGNAYVNVSFVRAVDSPEIYMSPLSYAAAPFSVSRERREVTIELNVPAEAKPGQPLKIGYQVSRPCSLVVFAVDEGILQVAGYKTPDPLGYFFRKGALEVQTAQILDLLLPEASIVRSVAAVGGGVGAEELARQLNPFRRKQQKPIAYWSGILDANPGGGSVTYEVPDYFNGRLRIMAVGVAREALGSTERPITVRGPFVINPNSPLFAAPGDEFTVSVSVANNVRGSGAGHPVELRVVPSDQLEVKEPIAEVTVDEGRDASVSFVVKAKESLGGAELRFTASDGNEQSSLSAFLSVRPAVSYRTTLQTGVLESGRAEVKLFRDLHPEFRTLELTASYLPLGLASGLSTYLEGYPYGCTEQIVSQAVPALILGGTPEIGMSVAERLQKFRETALILQARQNAEGAFGTWAATSQGHPFYSAYAVHYLTEAAEKGQPVPADLLQNGLAFLQEYASQKDTSSFWDLQTQCYAIYLLTRNGIVTTSAIGPVRQRLEAEGDAWKSSLAGIYLAASYRLMQESQEAFKLINQVKRDIRRGDENPNYYNRLIRDAQYLYVISLHFPDSLSTLGPELLQSIADELSRGEYSTIASSYIMMALQAYADAAGEPAAGRIELAELLGDGTERPILLAEQRVAVTAFSEDARAVAIRNREGRPLFYQVVQAGFDTEGPQQEETHGVEVFKELTGADGKPLREIGLGDDVYVHLRVRAAGKASLPEMAIVDLLPAGLEIDLAFLRHGADWGGGGDFRPDHIDVREDRIVVFGTVGKDLSEFVYRARAINSGRFLVPAAYAESMYDNRVWAVNPVEPIEIGK